VWHYPYPLEESAMVAAAGVVVGEHDFTSFAAVDPERVAAVENLGNRGQPSTALGNRERVFSNVRTIFSSSWTREGEELIYAIRGSGFLHYMVRNLVGTFLLMGKGTVSLEDLRRILEARERTAAGPTAPAGGLYLVEVEY
jgi:tRNA pseudouridine38-40 synthase